MRRLIRWWNDRREYHLRQKRCFHHDHTSGESWIRGQIVDLGRAKHFWCQRCFRYWT